MYLIEYQYVNNILTIFIILKLKKKTYNLHIPHMFAFSKAHNFAAENIQYHASKYYHNR